MTRRRILAGVFGALPALLIAGVLMGQGQGHPLTAVAAPPPSPPSTTSTPGPTRMPPVTASPTPPPAPTATPTPAATPTPSPSATPAPAPAPAPAASPPPAPALSTPQSPAGLSGLGLADVSGALVVADPLLAAQVQQVIQHPVAQQRPSLLHFSPQDRPGTLIASTGIDFLGGGSVVSGALVPTGLIASVMLVAGAAVLWLGRRVSTRRVLLVIGFAGVAAPMGAAVGCGAALADRGAVLSPVAHVGALVSRMMPDNALRARAMEPSRRSPTWDTLVGIEQAIDRDHQRLVVTETAISAANALLASAPATPAGSEPPAEQQAASTPAPSQPASPRVPGSGLLRPDVVTRVTNQLGSLVGQHSALATQYEQDLQREYDFFASAAQSPEQQDALVQAASLIAPDVASAVTYDITTVDTQIAQEAAIQAAEAAAAATPAPTVPGAFVPSGPISFHAPVGGIVTQSFGPTDFSIEPPVTYNGVFYPHFHTGLDIAAPLDQPVGAAAAGVVILATSSVDSAGHLAGYGNYVVVEHGDGFVTLYGHLDKLLVSTGQAVQQGQVIGLLGSTGWSTGPHVHFEIRVNDKPVDPAPYLAAQLRR